MNLKKKLLSTSRFNKKLIVLLNDFFCICLASIFALIISNIDFRLVNLEESISLIWIPVFCLVTFWYLGVYSSVVRYIDFSVILIIGKAIIFVLIVNFVIKLLYISIFNYFTFPRTLESLVGIEGWLVGLVTFSFLIIASRLMAHFYLSDRLSEKRVIIYGAGSAGIQLASALRVSKEMQPIAFIDRNPALQGTYFGGVKVLHPKRLEKLCSRGGVDEVLIAMPSTSKTALRELLQEIENYSVKVRILPGVAELAQGKILVSELKEVNIGDLLGRLEVGAHQDLINNNIENKVVLVTGAGGSIGSEIARQSQQSGARKLILLDSNEYSLYAIQSELDSFDCQTEIYSILANVTNQERMESVCKTFKVQTVYHAAAYKHVPLVEENPFEAVFNNIWGTLSVSLAAIETKVETFVLISTDKAVRPTNIMGATKRFSELILQSLSVEKSKNTKMTMVRFGNVLGSSGSAIPLFQQQIKDGGPVTVTHPEVIRYFMSIPEAAELVIQAGAMGKGGDVFVLDMGEPVKILDLAKRLVKLSGMELKDDNNKNGEIEIIFTGLRPGEKLFEELLIGNKVSKTKHPQILRAEEKFIIWKDLEVILEDIKKAKSDHDIVGLRSIFKKNVAGFSPDKIIADVIYNETL